MLRNRLRTLEQQLNAAELPEDLKVKLQGYITGCYGSLTSFNVLFAEEDDQFKGSGGRLATSSQPRTRNLIGQWANTSTSSRSPASSASAT